MNFGVEDLLIVFFCRLSHFVLFVEEEGFAIHPPQYPLKMFFFGSPCDLRVPSLDGLFEGDEGPLSTMVDGRSPAGAHQIRLPGHSE